MAVVSEGARCTRRGFYDLGNQPSVSLLHSVTPTSKKRYANKFPKYHSQQPLSEDTWFLLSNHPSNTSADLNARAQARRREHLLNAYCVLGTVLVTLMPCLSYHITPPHHLSISPSTHSKEGRDTRYSNWWWCSTTIVITWEAWQSQGPLVTLGLSHFHMESMGGNPHP